jgi:hypothetical protein
VREERFSNESLRAYRNRIDREHEEGKRGGG